MSKNLYVFIYLFFFLWLAKNALSWKKYIYLYIKHYVSLLSRRSLVYADYIPCRGIRAPHRPPKRRKRCFYDTILYLMVRLQLWSYKGSEEYLFNVNIDQTDCQSTLPSKKRKKKFSFTLNWLRLYVDIIYIYPPTPHKQDVTRGQCISRV